MLYFQEGQLAIRLTFSDGTSTNLNAIVPDDFYLSVKSLDPEVIAYTPGKDRSSHRIIAIGNGEKGKLRISLELPDACTRKNHVALATARTAVDLRIKASKEDGADRKTSMKAKAVNMGDLGDSSPADIALRDDQRYYNGKDGDLPPRYTTLS